MYYSPSFLSCLLLQGVTKRKSGYILAWLVIRSIGTVACAILAAACVAFYFIATENQSEVLPQSVFDSK